MAMAALVKGSDAMVPINAQTGRPIACQLKCACSFDLNLNLKERRRFQPP